MSKRLLLAAVLVIAPTLTSAVAQTPGPPAGGSDRNLRDEMSPIKGRSNEMERVKRDAEKPEKSNKPDNPESRPAPNFAEIKEDFERIQIINNDVLQASRTPDYQVISESAAEIKKRAIRLKSNLFPPESGKKSKEAKPAPEDQELKSLLTLLDTSIASFTHSPIFQNAKVVNPEDSTSAQKDLDNIIKLSTRIVLEADRIKKSN